MLEWRRIKWDFTGNIWEAFSRAPGIVYRIDKDSRGFVTLTITHRSFFIDEVYSKQWSLTHVDDARKLAEHMERNVA
jgi:hypothetical protein